MTVRCVCFDLDDTLWDCKSVISQAEQQLYRWLSRYQPAISERYTAEELIESRIRYVRSYPGLQYDLGRLRLNWLAELADEAGTGRDWVNDAFEHFLQARSNVKFFPGVIEQLQRLKPDYILGSITNGNADIHRAGLGGFFSFAHDSARAGVSKPHPAIFEQAVAMSGVAPEQIVYVGDDQERDIIGANRAGLRTIWYNPSRQTLIAGAAPDAVMTSFNELTVLVHSL